MQLNNSKATAIQFLGLAFLAISVFTSCKKEDDDHQHDNDSTPPVVLISSPLASNTYNKGDTVRIFAKVSDASLHELLVRIENDSNRMEYFRYTPVVHDLTYYEVDTYWVNNVSSQVKASVIVTAEDHSSNVDSAMVKVTLKP